MSANYKNPYQYFLAGHYSTCVDNKEWTWKGARVKFGFASYETFVEDNIDLLPMVILYENETVEKEELKKWYQMLNFKFV